jgi:hypothetical protein
VSHMNPVWFFMKKSDLNLVCGIRVSLAATQGYDSVVVSLRSFSS